MTPASATAPQDVDETLEGIGRAAVRALYCELAIDPKPGLVSFRSSGSHDDMDAGTFMRSISALRPYFDDIAAAGHHGAGFEELRQLGLEAERRMLAATGGVNTHRGAVFALGLLAAGAGVLLRRRRPLSAGAVARTVAVIWGRDIVRAGLRAGPSHGRRVAQLYGAGGARQEAARGFPAVTGLALPSFRRAMQRTRCLRAAAVETLFMLIATLDDTNVLHRGGPQGAAFAKASARGFLRSGGTLARDWEHRAAAICAEFVARRLSPGGCADLLAATFFLAKLDPAGDGRGSWTDLPRAG
jgi:triphosphoribosyl-dephospho-CoA synthase